MRRARRWSRRPRRRASTIWAKPASRPRPRGRRRRRGPARARDPGTGGAGLGRVAALGHVHLERGLAADADVGAGVRGGEELVEGRVQRVAEDERPGHERDAEHDREGGQQEPELAGEQALEGDAQHRSGPPLAGHVEALHPVEHRVGGGVVHLVDDVAVGEEHDPVGVRGGGRVVGDDRRSSAPSRAPTAAGRSSTSAPDRESRLPVGSSAKTTSGRPASARAHGDALLLAAGELAGPVVQPVRRGRRCR